MIIPSICTIPGDFQGALMKMSSPPTPTGGSPNFRVMLTADKFMLVLPLKEPEWVRKH